MTSGTKSSDCVFLRSIFLSCNEVGGFAPTMRDMENLTMKTRGIAFGWNFPLEKLRTAYGGLLEAEASKNE